MCHIISFITSSTSDNNICLNRDKYLWYLSGAADDHDKLNPVKNRKMRRL